MCYVELVSDSTVLIVTKCNCKEVLINPIIQAGTHNYHHACPLHITMWKGCSLTYTEQILENICIILLIMNLYYCSIINVSFNVIIYMYNSIFKYILQNDKVFIVTFWYQENVGYMKEGTILVEPHCCQVSYLPALHHSSLAVLLLL
jgi:hypothetical protein